SDVDTTDTLTFDIYFGTDSSSLSLIGSDQTAASLVSPTLSASTVYYWNVVVKDGQGGQTIGQVWNFTTD
ncbi:MAG: hypothetical protein HKP59_10420, partial [Lutibacter sp.]|nr:hypothetical protein [Lutibacter sp.]NNJ58887.1 hypothetical protein [Lutibacter sp.]